MTPPLHTPSRAHGPANRQPGIRNDATQRKEVQMKVEVDLSKCLSYAICVGIAPDVFQFDVDGLLVVLRADVAQGDEDRIRSAVVSCPTQALLLTED